MNTDNVMIGLVVAFFGAIIAAVIGWVLNILKLLSVAINSFTGNEAEVVVRAVGVFFAPIGAVAGYF